MVMMTYGGLFMYQEEETPAFFACNLCESHTHLLYFKEFFSYLKSFAKTYYNIANDLQRLKLISLFLFSIQMSLFGIFYYISIEHASF